LLSIYLSNSKAKMTAIRAAEDVLVIGAGPAGIASADALEKAGIRYKVIDRANVIGSTWDRLYPTLRLNTTRFFSHMAQKRFPLAYGFYPTGRQYHDYLLEFVGEHHFNIQLGITVHRVAPQGQLWRVETDSGTWLYPTIISATGVWNNPHMPQIAGMQDFRGTLIHAHDFRHAEQVTGQRVLVVGNGPSGVDIAVASSATAASTHIAIRSGIKLVRRFPLGMPKQFWLMLGALLPGKWCDRLLKFVDQFGYGDTSAIGLIPPPPGAGGMTAYQGTELIDVVQAGKVTPINSAPHQFHAQAVTFADGSTHEFDTVIMATGYLPVLHQYLDIKMQYSPEAWKPAPACDWMQGENGQRGWPLRDTTQHPNGRQVLGHPGLYLVGVFYKGKGAMYNFNVEAAIAAAQIQAYLEQWREVEPQSIV
jgi:cation diffusion facilitator CzcD-associated flavoprotein CzcO